MWQVKNFDEACDQIFEVKNKFTDSENLAIGHQMIELEEEYLKKIAESVKVTRKVDIANTAIADEHVALLFKYRRDRSTRLRETIDALMLVDLKDKSTFKPQCVIAIAYMQDFKKQINDERAANGAYTPLTISEEQFDNNELIERNATEALNVFMKRFRPLISIQLLLQKEFRVIDRKRTRGDSLRSLVKKINDIGQMLTDGSPPVSFKSALV